MVQKIVCYGNHRCKIEVLKKILPILKHPQIKRKNPQKPADAQESGGGRSDKQPPPPSRTIGPDLETLGMNSACPETTSTRKDEGFTSHALNPNGTPLTPPPHLPARCAELREH